MVFLLVHTLNTLYKSATRARKVFPLLFAVGYMTERTAPVQRAVTTREPGPRQAATSWDAYEQRRSSAGIHISEWWEHPWRIPHTRVLIRKQFASPGRVMRARARLINDHAATPTRNSSSASGNPRGVPSTPGIPTVRSRQTNGNTRGIRTR